MHHLRLLTLLCLAGLAVSPLRAADPTDNPVATFYAGPEGYPAWTDAHNWRHVINMKTYARGNSDFEKFENARNELSEGGGVLYYPAGTYDFTTMPPGRGLMLCHDVIIRGEAPEGHPLARDGKLELPTKFLFPFRERGRNAVPADWNFIGIQIEKGKALKDIKNIGICWVHLVGATIAFGPDVEGGRSWAAGMGARVKKGWNVRVPDGTHPFDALTGPNRKYRGGASGRLVFGCVLEDAAVLDDFSDPGYGHDGFTTQRDCARIIAYGSRVFVANNLLPESKRNFGYRQRTRSHPAERGGAILLFDYGRTCGIDINKGLLTMARQNGTCPGYFEPGIVVRDNFVYNHGHTGFNVAGSWVTITGNVNERAFLRPGDDVYNLNLPWVLTLDGWEVAGPNSDSRSRAFDLAGRNLWIDGNRFSAVGSEPGSDGEGIVCRSPGTPLYSWAITHNVHARGGRVPGLLGGQDVDCHGLLIAWNQAFGPVGCEVRKPGTKLTDCAFLANQCEGTLPDEKTLARLGLPAPLTVSSAGSLAAPAKVTVGPYQKDAVQITWTSVPKSAAGFRVERRMEEGKWAVIAYRPPRLQGDADNPQTWIDFTAPPGKKLTYRVVAVGAEDNDQGASPASEAIALGRP